MEDDGQGLGAEGGEETEGSPPAPSSSNAMVVASTVAGTATGGGGGGIGIGIGGGLTALRVGAPAVCLRLLTESLLVLAKNDRDNRETRFAQVSRAWPYPCASPYLTPSEPSRFVCVCPRFDLSITINPLYSFIILSIPSSTLSTHSFPSSPSLPFLPSLLFPPPLLFTSLISLPSFHLPSFLSPPFLPFFPFNSLTPLPSSQLSHSPSSLPSLTPLPPSPPSLPFLPPLLPLPQRIAAWELVKDKHERFLRPVLGSPERSDDLAQLDRVEKERSNDLTR